MDLVDRYLQAVKQWLPAKQREDIIAELGDDIRSEIDEKESGLGRKLEEPELEEVLRRRGRPILAAARYGPQQSVIGPALFPIYMVALKATAIPFLAFSIGRWIYLLISSASIRAESPLALLTQAWSAFASLGLFLFGGITLGFAVVEWVDRRRPFLDRWNPRSLSPVPAVPRVPRSSSVTEFAVQIAFALWWIRPQSFFTLKADVTGWSASPTWAHIHGTFFVPVLVVTLAVAALNCAEFLRPRRTPLRSVLRAAMELSVTWIALVVLAAHWGGVRAEWQGLRAGTFSEVAAVTAVTDLFVYCLVAMVGIGAFVVYLVETIRAIRLRSRNRAGMPALGLITTPR